MILHVSKRHDANMKDSLKSGREAKCDQRDARLR